jgi:hypothetical protein
MNSFFGFIKKVVREINLANSFNTPKKTDYPLYKKTDNPQ